MKRFVIWTLAVVLIAVTWVSANYEEWKIETVKWTFYKNTDTNKQWNKMYWANLKMNNLYFKKRWWEDLIWKKAEVTIKWWKAKTFKILDVKLIEDIEIEKTVEEEKEVINEMIEKKIYSNEAQIK